MIYKRELKIAGLSLAVSLFATTLQAQTGTAQNLLKGGSFSTIEKGAPTGWSFYGKKDAGSLNIQDGALRLEDTGKTGEIGIVQTVPVQAGQAYGVRVTAREVAPGSTRGAFLQLRFLPSNKYHQIGLDEPEAEEWNPGDWSTFVASGIAPEGTTSAQIYVYSHAAPTPQLLVRQVELMPGLKAKAGYAEPVPPQYTKFKELHLTTHLVRDGKANGVIAVPGNPRYRAAAEALQKAISARSGVTLPIVSDAQVKVPLEQNVILLGNRSTNSAIRTLYDRFFALTDLKYPGAGGYEVRSVHNPFGNGFNAILVGSSDDAGVASGANVLSEKLRGATGGQGALSLGHLMEIKLGAGLEVPKELKDFHIWEGSKGYGSTGYFGWNSISKRMAMYYMTGDPFQAREALRLAFPDAKAKEELARTDGELTENKDDPLAGPYHYNATHLILFWDLIEESPVFTDAERLKVFNAFSRQLKHRVAEDGNIYGLRRPAQTIGSRHGLYGALSLYALARYFHRDDPESPVWRQAWRGSNFYFEPLAKPNPWVFGENDNLFWFSTSNAPILTYMALSGDHRALQSGSLAKLLRTQELLFNGRRDDRNLSYASLDYLNKAAVLTGDGRWITYRERTNLDTDGFRLGQSFWPDPSIKPVEPVDLLNRWSVAYLPPDYAASRTAGFSLDQAFMNASYRSATDGSGDYLFLDGINGSGRNPYHTFAVLEMRFNGQAVLQGYNNQVQTKADGMVEPRVAMDAALLHHDVIGQTATATASVPRSAFSDWTRTIAQRTGRYALVMDDVKFRTDSDNFEAQFLWQKISAGWRGQDNGARLMQTGAGQWKSGGTVVRALDAQLKPLPANTRIAELSNLDTAMLRSEEAGAAFEMPFEVRQAWNGKVWVRLLDFHDRGILKFALDGKPVGAPHDSYAPETRWTELDLGTHQLAPGTHRLRVEVTGKNPRSSNFFAGLVGVALEAPGTSPPGKSVPQIVSADAMKLRIKGDVATQIWEGKAQNGEHKKFFSLVGQGSETQPLQAHRLSENAAALRLPQPALAVAGEHNNTRGELVLLAADHAFGKSATGVGVGSSLLSASQPVDFDWDFTTGELHLVNAQAAEISLALEPDAKLTTGGKPLAATSTAGTSKFNLPAGRHLLANAKPAIRMINALAKELSQLEIAPQDAPSATDGNIAATPLKAVFDAKVSGDIAASIVTRDGDTTRTFVAAGNTVVELDAAGKTVRTLTTDGPIRVLHWWPQHKLLLAGCTDEKVIAFDAAGNRKWTFVSEMDPAVFRAAKQYWFKTAPGHNGIHGLDSGVFLDGKSQLFVGSACTLEILDENGKLVKRLPQFWGTVALFKIVPGPDNSLNLLAARSITEYPNLGVISNKTLNPSPRSFRDVPAGVTPVNGWGDQVRFHIFHEDVDGDGQKEVISEITGAWNRVTVWDESGKPKYNVQFGPGANSSGSGMSRTTPIRDIDIADIDGDAKPEIMVALSDGLIVALDGQCRKKWSRRLEQVPSSLAIINGKTVVGCENGDVLLLDGKGATIRRANIAARVNELKSHSPLQFVAYGAGGIVKAFQVD